MDEYLKLNLKGFSKMLASIAITVVGLYWTVDNAYKAGQYLKVLQAHENGYNPVEIFIKNP